jgi:3-mercaptopropionate dioxygenase
MDAEEFLLDTPVVRSFVADVRAAIAAAESPEAACDAIRPRFAGLLADDDWLPERYRESAPESGMGGGIGQWLLFRAGDRSLSLFALVVPPERRRPCTTTSPGAWSACTAGRRTRRSTRPAMTAGR